MIAGVISVPKRRALVDNLQSLISPSVDKFIIFEDVDYNGHWWNMSRAMKELYGMARQGEPVLLMTDDATTVQDWRDRWEAIHSIAKDTRYVLFSRRPHLFRPEHLSKGFVQGCIPRGYYDQANIFINHHTLIQDVLRWFEGGGKHTPSVIKRQKHLDVVIQEYLIAHNMPWTVTVPTLFDTVKVQSTLGHGTAWQSLNYIGNQKILKL